MMRKETIEKIVANARAFLSAGQSISVRQWPVAPFEPTDYYVDFQIQNLLYGTENLKDLTPEKFFDLMESGQLNGTHAAYHEWKKEWLRDLRIDEILEYQFA